MPLAQELGSEQSDSSADEDAWAKCKLFVFDLVAGCGIAPHLSGYEPDVLLLHLPAMSISIYIVAENTNLAIIIDKLILAS